MERYADDYEWYEVYGSGAIYNIDYAYGEDPDGYGCNLYANGDGSLARVAYELDHSANGNVYVKAKCPGAGTNAHMYLYCSPDNNNWYFCSDKVITTGSYAWYDMGKPDCFNYKYALVISYDDITGASSLYVDCINTGHSPE